jgi:hypothetical protein
MCYTPYTQAGKPGITGDQLCRAYRALADACRAYPALTGACRAYPALARAYRIYPAMARAYRAYPALTGVTIPALTCFARARRQARAQ